MLFTALEALPGLLSSMGVHVVEVDGWRAGQSTPQSPYLWADPDGGLSTHATAPSAFMVHHSASSAATIPTAATSKGNAWAGLWRDGKLYQSGGGIPTVALASAGPARISAGYGYWPALELVHNGVRPPWRAQGPDGDRAGNRYAFSVETVHRGDGSQLDEGVFEVLVTLGVALEELVGRGPMTLGHVSWSQRKIDPYWSTGRSHDGESCIVDVQDEIDRRRQMGMTLERWATRLRNPVDFDRMVEVGILTAAERDYWVTVPTDSPEFQDLRDAVEVRSPLYG